MNCDICRRIEDIRANRTPDLIAELSGGYLVLGDHQFFRGYVVFLAKIHTLELHELPDADREAFLADMPRVGQAVWNALAPSKLNYEILGNSDPHVHAHIFPRHADDPNPKGPIWMVSKEVRQAESARLDQPARAELIRRIREELDTLPTHDTL